MDSVGLFVAYGIQEWHTKFDVSNYKIATPPDFCSISNKLPVLSGMPIIYA